MNKYLHTVASVGFLFTLNYDARNHELKKKNVVVTLTYNIIVVSTEISMLFTINLLIFTQRDEFY